MKKVEAWLGVRLDRIADRWGRFADSVSARWYRSLDRIADRWGRFADSVSAPWYRSVDRIADRWFGFVDRIGDLKERFTESFFVGWDRLANRQRGRRVRTAWSGGERPRRRVVDLIVVLALTGIVGLASMVTLYAFRDAGGERSAADAVLSGPGGSSDRGVEGSGGMGPAPGEQAPASDGSGTQLGAFRVYRDERTGNRFSYPNGWEVSASEGITRLVDSAGEVIISFRSAPSGTIEDFSEGLMEILASRYGPLDLVAREEGETPQGEPSLVLGGRATDTDGSSINFMIVAIEGPDRNRAITARFSADSNLLDLSSSIRRIVGSFTTSAASVTAT